MLYLYVKAIHIVMVVCWMAGLFYFVRLLIYHTETEKKSEDIKAVLTTQFSIMEKRLWNIITQPAMILSWISGIWMLSLNPQLLKTEWMWVKISFLLVLSYYHFKSLIISKKLQKNTYPWSSMRLRLWNEWATVLLVAIVFVAVIKTSIDWIWGVVGLIVLSVILTAFINLYNKHLRNKK